MTRIIAFTGLAQAGKSTAADALVEVGWTRFSFAKPVKDMLAVLTRETDKLATPPELCGKTVREGYQLLGTDWGRKLIGEDIWVQAGKRRICEMLADGVEGIVCDDLRFDNEADLIREMGGLVVAVHRPGLEQMEHASEAGISTSKVHVVLSNNEGMDTLKAAACRLIS